MEKYGPSRRDLLALLAVAGVGAAECELAAAQTVADAEGTSVRAIVENDKARVVAHQARPRMGVCGTGLHSHPPHLTIALTDVRARVTLPGKEPFIAENKAGDVFWDPDGPHVVEKLGSRDSKVYLVGVTGVT